MTTTTPARLSWLTGEVRSWQAAGLIGEDQADAILAGYAPGHRLSLVRLLLAVGACFVGVGVLWLVAANLESLSPTARVVLVATVWLTALAGGEVLHSRSAPAPVVGAVRLLAALLVGALVFQAAQSLQVPAYEPFLLACWAAAALVHAYAAGAVTPLLAGVVTGTVYTLWAVLGSAPSGVALVLTLATVGLAAVGLAAVHDARTPEFARVWRLSGVGLLLLSLVVGAVPGLDLGSESLPLDLVVGLVATALLVAALVFLVMLVALNRRMGEIERTGIQVNSLLISREENTVYLNNLDFKLTAAAMETLSVLAEARLDDEVLSGAEIEAMISGRDAADCDESAGATRIKRLRDTLGNQMVSELLVKNIARRGYMLAIEKDVIRMV